MLVALPLAQGDNLCPYHWGGWAGKPHVHRSGPETRLRLQACIDMKHHLLQNGYFSGSCAYAEMIHSVLGFYSHLSIPIAYIKLTNKHTSTIQDQVWMASEGTRAA